MIQKLIKESFKVLSMVGIACIYSFLSHLVALALGYWLGWSIVFIGLSIVVIGGGIFLSRFLCASMQNSKILHIFIYYIAVVHAVLNVWNAHQYATILESPW